jgi:hypothetical protein
VLEYVKGNVIDGALPPSQEHCACSSDYTHRNVRCLFRSVVGEYANPTRRVKDLDDDHEQTRKPRFSHPLAVGVILFALSTAVAIVLKVTIDRAESRQSSERYRDGGVVHRDRGGES